MGLCLKGNKLLEYFKNLLILDLPYGHNALTGKPSQIGCCMAKLYNGEELALQQLSESFDVTCPKHNMDMSEWTKQYQRYLEIIKERNLYISKNPKLQNIVTLSEENFYMWGSHRQLKFGVVVLDTLEENLHPVFGALLSPTGGIVGPSNTNLYIGDTSSEYVMHGIVHDAGGYCYNYHNKGPGYNYLNTKFTLFPTHSCLSNQIWGILTWKKIIKPHYGLFKIFASYVFDTLANINKNQINKWTYNTLRNN